MAVYPGLHPGIPIHEAGREASRSEIAPFRPQDNTTHGFTGRSDFGRIKIENWETVGGGEDETAVRFSGCFQFLEAIGPFHPSL
jgi:hypothetical protein